MAELHGPLPARAIDHLANGDLIAAIRIIRAESGLGLKDAKDVADNYVRSHPELAPALEAKRAAAGRRTLLFALAYMLVGLVVIAAIRLLRSA